MNYIKAKLLKGKVFIPAWKVGSINQINIPGAGYYYIRGETIKQQMLELKQGKGYYIVSMYKLTRSIELAM